MKWRTWRNLPIILGVVWIATWITLTVVFGWGWWGWWYGR